MVSMTPVAATIHAIRSAHGWTQAELAERIGASQVNVSRWESGTRKPPASAVARLCEVAPDGGAALLAALRDTDNTRKDGGR
jgi:transcriptional regulator with XRE-family HTH domain